MNEFGNKCLLTGDKELLRVLLDRLLNIAKGFKNKKQVI